MKQYGVTVLRVVVGVIYLMQAYLALFASNPRAVAAFVAKLGLPVPTLLAVLVIIVHGFGGAMLVIGLGTRVAATLNAAILLVTLLTVYVRQGALLKGALIDTVVGRAPGHGYEYVGLLVAATVMLAAGGGGAAAPGRSK